MSAVRAPRRPRRRGAAGGGRWPGPRGRLALAIDLCLGALLVAFTLLLFPPVSPPPRFDFHVGDVTQTGEEVIAPISFKVPVNAERLAEQRAIASLAVPPVYRLDPSVARQLRLRLDKLDSDLEASWAIEPDSLDTPALSAERLAGVHPTLPPSALAVLVERGQQLPILPRVRETVDSLLAHGILDTRQPLVQGRFGAVQLTLLRPGQERLAEEGEVVDQEELSRLLAERVAGLRGWDEPAKNALRALSRAHLRPNYFHDPAETAARKRRAAESVPDHVVVAKGVRILGGNVQVTQEHLDRLTALEASLGLESTSVWRTIALYVGRGLLLALILALAVRLLSLYDDGFFTDARRVFLLAGLLALFLGTSRIALGLEQGGEYLLPITFVAMILAGLYDAQLSALGSGLALALLGAAAGPPAGSLLVAAFAAGAAIFSIREVRHRLQLYKSIAYIALAYVLGIAAVHLGEGHFAGLISDSLRGMLGGLACAWLVMPILPLLERFFDVTTNFSLLELTDLNRPILKRMKVEAPGSFQHSLVVSNLAEAAADAIGANALLAKVCAYYHDIGKLAKPDYFGENLQGVKNRHEKLTPSMSALIIGAHVKEGLDLADRIKLPTVVKRAIPEHHGTTVMKYFYYKAMEQDPHGKVSPDDYRYPGPKPQSAETAILMLADTVEATVRSLDVPSSGKIRAVVSEAIDKRLSEGELEQCGLSISDLAAIRDSFVTTLLSIYHPRIQYPGDRIKETAEITLQPAAAPEASAGGYPGPEQEIPAGDGDPATEGSEVDAPEHPDESEVPRGL